MADGVLAVDKEPGVTSHDLVARVRRLVGRGVPVGHAGTLDPFATGVLLILVGRATKVASVVTGLDKSYEAVVRLGRRTSTDDRTGVVLDERPVQASRADVETALARFRGVIEQVPPQVSAVRVAGERMYHRARRGETVDLPARRVEVHALDVLAYEAPLLRVRLSCSSGTYVRALARDLGDVLGTGGSLDELERTRIGPFERTRCIPSRALTAPGAVSSAMLPLEEAVAFLPAVHLTVEQAMRMANGQAPVAADVTVDGDATAAHALRVIAPDGALIALADASERDALGRLVLRRVLRTWSAVAETGAA